MPGPKTKNWSALENEHKPSGLHLIVSGLVEVEPDQAPMLTERPGDIPEVLQLELEVGDSADADFNGKVWKQALFHKEVSANQYNSVRVRWQDYIAAQFPVIDDRERSQLLEKQAAAQNTVAGKSYSAKPKTAAAKPKATAAEKVMDKAVEAVKGAVKRVAKTITRTVTGKGSKKAAKKTTKKVGKKSAKRAAKKTAKKSATRPAKKYADRPGKKTAKKTKAVRRPARKAKRR